MPRFRILTVLLALAIAAPGCSRGGGRADCEQAYEMTRKCGSLGTPNPEVSEQERKQRFVDRCEKARKDPKRKQEFEEDLACLNRGSCEEAEACGKAMRARRRAKEIAAAAAEGRWRDAFDDCAQREDLFADDTYRAECAKVFASTDKVAAAGDLSSVMFGCKAGDKIKQVAPDFAQACKTLAAGQLASAQQAATAARDAGKNDFKLCSDLRVAAELAGGEAAPAAQQLCDEMVAAEDARAATAEARKHVAEKQPAVPTRCESAADKLSKLDTGWAKQALEDLDRACHVELGAVVIEARAKDARYSCPGEIKKIAEAAGKRELAARFPELAEALKKLPAKCKK